MFAEILQGWLVVFPKYLEGNFSVEYSVNLRLGDYIRIGDIAVECGTSRVDILSTGCCNAVLFSPERRD